MSNEHEMRIIEEIALRYGNNINIEKYPFVLAEILRNYGGRFSGAALDEFGSGAGTVGTVGSGTTGISPPTSGIGGTGPAGGEANLSDVMKVILRLQRQVSDIDIQLKEFVGLYRLTLEEKASDVPAKRLNDTSSKTETSPKRK